MCLHQKRRDFAKNEKCETRSKKSPSMVLSIRKKSNPKTKMALPRIAGLRNPVARSEKRFRRQGLYPVAAGVRRYTRRTKKARAGEVIRFSLPDLSHSQEWLCISPTKKILGVFVLAPRSSPYRRGFHFTSCSTVVAPPTFLSRNRRF